MNKRFIKILAITTASIGLTTTVYNGFSPQTNVVQAATTTQKTVSMLVYKDSVNHKSRQKSMARGFVGTKAKVTVKNGKVNKLVIHVDGKNSALGKGKDVEKIVSSLKVNGVSGKKENISKDHSSFDFVFSAKAFKNNAWVKMSVTIDFGGKMAESAWIKFGKVSGVKTTATVKKTKSITNKKVSK